jgi:RNA polymerase sigma factor (sigma-70 family)
MTPHNDELIQTRTSLIDRLKDWQDQSSWQDFFDTYWKLIYGVALKAGLTAVEAQDVVQETMISVAKHMPTFEYDPAIGSFKTWLLNMTRWRIVDQMRKRGPQIPYTSSSGSTALGVGSTNKVIDPESEALRGIWDAEWERNLLDAAIANVKRHLDPKEYQIYDICANKDWSAEKVAETFGVSVDRVNLIKHRVIEKIKEEIKRLERNMT